jgi:hypothetical protein
VTIIVARRWIGAERREGKEARRRQKEFICAAREHFDVFTSRDVNLRTSWPTPIIWFILQYKVVESHNPQRKANDIFRGNE